MSKPSYNRSAGSSFVPKTAGMNESERQETLLTRGSKGAYYSSLSKAPKAGGAWKPVLPRMTEAEKVQQRKHLARKRLIKEIAEL